MYELFFFYFFIYKGASYKKKHKPTKLYCNRAFNQQLNEKNTEMKDLIMFAKNTIKTFEKDFLRKKSEITSQLDFKILEKSCNLCFFSNALLENTVRDLHNANIFIKRVKSCHSKNFELVNNPLDKKYDKKIFLCFFYRFAMVYTTDWCLRLPLDQGIYESIGICINKLNNYTLSTRNNINAIKKLANTYINQFQEFIIESIHFIYKNKIEKLFRISELVILNSNNAILYKLFKLYNSYMKSSRLMFFTFRNNINIFPELIFTNLVQYELMRRITIFSFELYIYNLDEIIKKIELVQIDLFDSKKFMGIIEELSEDGIKDIEESVLKKIVKIKSNLEKIYNEPDENYENGRVLAIKIYDIRSPEDFLSNFDIEKLIIFSRRALSHIILQNLNLNSDLLYIFYKKNCLEYVFYMQKKEKFLFQEDIEHFFAEFGHEIRSSNNEIKYNEKILSKIIETEYINFKNILQKFLCKQKISHKFFNHLKDYNTKFIERFIKIKETQMLECLEKTNKAHDQKNIYEFEYKITQIENLFFCDIQYLIENYFSDFSVFWLEFVQNENDNFTDFKNKIKELFKLCQNKIKNAYDDHFTKLIDLSNVTIPALDSECFQFYSLGFQQNILLDLCYILSNYSMYFKKDLNDLVSLLAEKLTEQNSVILLQRLYHNNDKKNYLYDYYECSNILSCIDLSGKNKNYKNIPLQNIYNPKFKNY